jgi:phenylpropionate dioxygenase-like ring-hydroxylating dioxygenase large terminal subunit
MLSDADNEILTRVGPGTPMGNLLRRYWMPCLLSNEIPEADGAPVRVRILGEDLVAFRDSEGRAGMFVQACPHRGASMFFGRNEEAGLRCVYHGWKFDVSGACVDMPSEPAESNFKSKVRIRAYPTVESGGIVWAYMGPPEKQPAFRDFIGENLEPEEWSARKLASDCNWVQGLEGNLDTAHISFLHRSLADFSRQGDDTDRPGYPSETMSTVIRGGDQAPAIEVEDTWYGFRYAGLRKTPAGYTHARVTDFIMPFGCYIATTPVGGDNLLMMVPIDDDHFFRLSFTTKRAMKAPGYEKLANNAMGARSAPMPPPPPSPFPERQSLANDFFIDREAQKSVSYTGIRGIPQQDMAVTESMGAIYDRSHEHLGRTDAAVIRMRRMLIKAAMDLENGIEPPALDASMPFTSIRSAEKVLEPDEDWRRLGTEGDPVLAQVVAQ